MDLITFEEAVRKRLPRFFTGKPCKRGHIGERHTAGKGCVECNKLDVQKQRESDRQKYNAYQREYAASHRPDFAVYNYTASLKNKALRNSLEAKRRSAKLNRTPPWADLQKIREIYKQCPSGFQVDHVIPLQGEFVSGLHVETNLQYLTSTENAMKGNRYVERA